MLKITALMMTFLLVLQATPLLKTGQILSYDSDGNEVTDDSVKDDGYYQAGTTRSYSRNGDIVIDNVTDLEWQDNEEVSRRWLSDKNYEICKNNNSSAACYDTTGETAVTYCTDLSLGGHSDWRLPALKELLTLVDSSNFRPSVTNDVFQNITANPYWSFTSTNAYPDSAWYMSFGNGGLSMESKSYDKSVLCVRTKE